MKHTIAEVGTRAEAAAPHIRSLEMMLDDMRSKTPASSPLRPFLPTMPADQYMALKAKLRAQGFSAEKPLAEKPRPHAPVVLIGPEFAGASNVDGLWPPDTHGAIGVSEFVEVSNSHIDIYQRSDPANRTSLSLAAFFGYSAQTLFDPRAVYDSTWNRWIITAEAFPESSTLQYHFIGISTTADALSPFFIYAINVAFFADDFWDYPQLGMDQDSIIITANIFGTAGFKGADMFAVAKASLYNGWGFSVPVFVGLVGTLAPPIVLDQNARTFLLAAPPGGSQLYLYTLTNSSRPNATQLTGPVGVPVDAYAPPPPAPQPGTTAVLDTLDARFVNASTQTGTSLWQVHSIDYYGFATPKFYQINTETNTVTQSNFFYGTSTSYDFNASIAANGDNDIFLTWSMTDPTAGTNAQVRFSGCDHHDGACAPGAGMAVYTSPTSYAGFRWGDYSAVTIDPLNRRHAWLVNEAITAVGDWGSRIARVGFAA